MRSYLVIRDPAGNDVSEQIETADGRCNPFGWSQYRLVHRKPGPYEVELRDAGWLYCGLPEMSNGYTAEVVDFYEHPQQARP